MDEKLASIDLKTCTDLLRENDLKEDEIMYALSLCFQFRNSKDMQPLIEDFMTIFDDLTGGMGTETIESWLSKLLAPTIH